MPLELLHSRYRIFRQFFLQYYAELCDFAQHFLRDPSEAEDLVQDVFVRAWERGINWEDSKRARLYLYRSIRNAALNHLAHQKMKRRRLQQFHQHTDSWSPSPEQVVHAAELTEAIEQALAKLPETRRTIFLLSRYHGLSYREIAQVMGISIKTVETQMGRVLRFLTQYLQPFTEKGSSSSATG